MEVLKQKPRSCVPASLHTMCSRGVWQCRSLLVQYCTRSGSSAGVRAWAERFLVPFAEANPQIQIALSEKPRRHPSVMAWYIQDNKKKLSLANLSAEQGPSSACQIQPPAFENV